MPVLLAPLVSTHLLAVGHPICQDSQLFCPANSAHFAMYACDVVRNSPGPRADILEYLLISVVIVRQ